MSKRALVVVDVQNDFISGSLSLSNCPSKHDGAQVVPIINKLVQETHFDLIAFTQDWHPTNHISFVDNVNLRPFHHSFDRSKEKVKVFDSVTFKINGASREQVLWPRHCVQESHGAELHPDLVVPPSSSSSSPSQSVVVVKKGKDPEVDSYSAFWDNSKLGATELEASLRAAEVEEVFVCGIATDVCVKATAVDALEHGFRVFLVEDACRGVEEGAIKSALEEIRTKGGKIISARDLS